MRINGFSKLEGSQRANLLKGLCECVRSESVEANALYLDWEPARKEAYKVLMKATEDWLRERGEVNIDLLEAISILVHPNYEYHDNYLGSYLVEALKHVEHVEL